MTQRCGPRCTISLKRSTAGNIWTDSKAAWVKIDPKHANFPKQAVDRTPLFDAWTRHNQD